MPSPRSSDLQDRCNLSEGLVDSMRSKHSELNSEMERSRSVLHCTNDVGAQESELQSPFLQLRLPNVNKATERISVR